MPKSFFTTSSTALTPKRSPRNRSNAVGEPPRYPDVSKHFPAALRMQRACADLVGIEAEAAPDHRPWLDHGA
ncbi:MAG TPA: NADH-quinone oxidoreductase subunit C, partial [bacterium]|nr:NADH-quinone oxidoreductase subunit C [bacterium]